VSALHFSKRQKRTGAQIRRVRVGRKEYRDVAYKAQFALGIICADEPEQQRLHRQLSQTLPGHEVKVLVI
jgi:hypothetical protein